MIFFVPKNKKQLLGLILLIGFYGSFFAYDYYQDSKLKNFENMNELKTFLKNDNTDQFTWTEEFTCDDFTRALIENAKNKGYRLKYESVEDPNSFWPSNDFYWDGDGLHAVCIAYLESTGKWYYIEPQQDFILGVKTS